jgi:hypothetical protein
VVDRAKIFFGEILGGVGENKDKVFSPDEVSFMCTFLQRKFGKQ